MQKDNCTSRGKIRRRHMHEKIHYMSCVGLEERTPARALGAYHSFLLFICCFWCRIFVKVKVPSCNNKPEPHLTFTSKCDVKLQLYENPAQAHV